jgi:hypothetical protein
VVEELDANRPVPNWLERDGTQGWVQRFPERGDVEHPINEDLILAFYAR